MFGINLNRKAAGERGDYLLGKTPAFSFGLFGQRPIDVLGDPAYLNRRHTSSYCTIHAFCMQQVRELGRPVGESIERREFPCRRAHPEQGWTVAE